MFAVSSFFIKSASLFCEAVLSGRTERLTQWNKTVLLSSYSKKTPTAKVGDELRLLPT